MNITHRLEYTLDDPERSALLALLSGCFPGFFSDRAYFKQLPHARLLGHVDGELVAQVGMDHRVVRVGDAPARVLGVVDLCVAESARGHGHGASLMREVESLASSGAVDFVILFADDHRLYDALGYTLVNRRCRWLAIDEHCSLDVFERQLDGCLMVKPTGLTSWPAGDVDLMGYLF